MNAPRGNTYLKPAILLTGKFVKHNAGMRGAKGSAWLGDTRAASFWRRPGIFQPGETKALTAHLDFFPTLAELAGAKLSAAVQRQVEGRSLVPLLQGPRAP